MYMYVDAYTYVQVCINILPSADGSWDGKGVWDPKGYVTAHHECSQYFFLLLIS